MVFIALITRTTNTGHQMSGISLLVPPFGFTVGGNLCQCQYKASGKIWMTSRAPLTKFYVQPSLLSSPGRPSFSGVLISPLALKAMWCIYVDHIQLWVVAVCNSLSQIKVAIMWTSIRPVIIKKYCSVVRSRAFSFSGDVENYGSVARCHLIKVLRSVRESNSLTQWLRRRLLKKITSKEDHAHFRIMRRNIFFRRPFGAQYQGGADQANWTPRPYPHI